MIVVVIVDLVQVVMHHMHLMHHMVGSMEVIDPMVGIGGLALFRKKGNQKPNRLQRLELRCSF